MDAAAVLLHIQLAAPLCTLGHCTMTIVAAACIYCRLA